MQVRVLLSAGKEVETLDFTRLLASFAWDEKGVLEGPEYDFDSNVDSNRRKSVIQKRSYTCDIYGVIGKYGMENGEASYNFQFPLHERIGGNIVLEGE